MKTIKLILIKDFKPLGHKNDIIDVNQGYALNYLIPNKVAIRHTQNSLSKLQKDLEIKQEERSKQLLSENEIKKALEEKALIISLKSHNNKAIGGANPSFLSKEISKQFNLEISKSLFLNTSSINDFGSFTRSIKLQHGTICNLKIEVNKENHE